MCLPVDRKTRATHSPVPRSSLSLEPRTTPHNSDTLIHHPFPNSEVFIDPRLELLALGDLLGFEAGGQACTPLDTGEEGRDEDRVEGVVGQSS